MLIMLQIKFATGNKEDDFKAAAGIFRIQDVNYSENEYKLDNLF